jgi:hypothetical protein
MTTNVIDLTQKSLVVRCRPTVGVDQPAFDLEAESTLARDEAALGQPVGEQPSLGIERRRNSSNAAGSKRLSVISCPIPQA